MILPFPRLFSLFHLEIPIHYQGKFKIALSEKAFLNFSVKKKTLSSLLTFVLCWYVDPRDDLPENKTSRISGQ
jgi:hypothetical protein